VVQLLPEKRQIFLLVGDLFKVRAKNFTCIMHVCTFIFTLHTLTV